MPGKTVPLQDRLFFENFYSRTHLVVFRYIYGLYGGPVEEVEDLTADTFLRAWKARQHFTGDEHAALGWLLEIARNRVIDAFRRERVYRSHTIQAQAENMQEIPGEEATPEEQASMLEQVDILRIMLLSLPLEQREMIVLRYIVGWPVKRIGEHLGLLENTVSVTLRRALLRIREKWPQELTSNAER